MSEAKQSPKQFLFKVMFVSTFGNLLFGYDTGVLNGALPYMARPSQLNLDPVLEGLVTSILLLGAAIGSFFGGRLADRYGRKKMLSFLAVLFFFGAMGCTFSPTAKIMVICRFFLGLAVGGAATIVPVYLAELAPAERRGRMVTQGELMIVTGQLLAFTFNAVIGVSMGGAEHVWRYMLSIAAIPAIVLFFGIRICPESPRWLVVNNRSDEALDILKKAREEDRAVRELKEIQDRIAQDAMQKKASLKDLATPWIRHIVILAVFLAACQQCTGVNSIMYYGTQILQKAGFGTEAALVANIANGVMSVSITFFAFWLLARYGRKKILMGGQLGIICVLIGISLSSHFLEGTDSLPYIILSLTVSFLGFQQAAVSPATWVLMSEILPNRIRGMGMGVTIMCLWLVNFCVGFSFPILLEYVGLTYTFFGFAVINMIALTLVYLFAPETMGKSLEQIEEMFHKRGEAKA